ncbi:helix-turn-helix domain-containing protein [Castellaniella caeni]
MFAQPDHPCLPRRQLALLVYDGIGATQLAGPLMVFDPQSLGTNAVEVRCVAVDAGVIKTGAGFSIQPEAGLGHLQSADAVLVLGWPGPDAPVPRALKQALRQACARGAQVVGLHLGCFVLAEAGLLDGRRATTHWQYSRLFAQRFPRVDIDPDILYVRDGNLWTSAGGCAAIDLCLLLLRYLAGAAVADQVAASLAVGLLRHGDQRQHIDASFFLDDSSRELRGLLVWMRTHLQEQQNLKILADRMHVSVRTFTRRFHQLTGLTVKQWRLKQQLASAQQLLESTDQSVEHVATQVGFGSALALRRHFRAFAGLSPSEYRRRCGTVNGLRAVAQAPGLPPAAGANFLSDP